jgi:Spy/CpxP family protein refolding chaperone
MSRRTVTALAAVLAAAGLLSLAHAGERPDGPHGGPGFGPDPARLAERLGLSEDQQAQLKALREKDREASRPVFEAARQAHEAFREALEAANPDPAVVGRAALAMHAAEKKARASREAAFEAMKAILTPEQLEKLEQGREEFGHRRGPGGRRPGGPPPNR